MLARQTAVDGMTAPARDLTAAGRMMVRRGQRHGMTASLGKLQFLDRTRATIAANRCGDGHR